MRARATAGAIIVAGLVGSTAACSESGHAPVDNPTTEAPAQPGPQTAVSGTTLTITGSGGTAAYTVGNLRPVPQAAQIIPARGTMYAVDVTIAAQTGTTAYNGFYFVARAADGSSIAPAVGAVNPGINYGELAPGQQVAAHVAFDVPPPKRITGILLRDPHGKPLALWAVG